jgi:hypothetical protein
MFYPIKKRLNMPQNISRYCPFNLTFCTYPVTPSPCQTLPWAQSILSHSYPGLTFFPLWYSGMQLFFIWIPMKSTIFGKSESGSPLGFKKFKIQLTFSSQDLSNHSPSRAILFNFKFFSFLACSW